MLSEFKQSITNFQYRYFFECNCLNIAIVLWVKIALSDNKKDLLLYFLHVKSYKKQPISQWVPVTGNISHINKWVKAIFMWPLIRTTIYLHNMSAKFLNPSRFAHAVITSCQCFWNAAEKIALP